MPEEDHVPEHDANDEVPSDGDSVTKLIFVRLDPILRMLLASLEQYKELVDVPSSDEERVLGFLRAQTKLLEALQDALTSLCNNDKTTEVPASLVVLTDYILLPIVLILEREQQLPKDNAALTNDPEWRRKVLIRQSSERKCVEAAARTLSIFVQCIYRGQESCAETGISVHENKDSSLENAALSPKILVRCLVACSVALPNDSSDSDSQAGVLGTHEALDKGEDCTMALLVCIESLVSRTTASGDAEDTLATAISGALQGALIARMVHCCISVLTTESNRPKETSRNANVDLCRQSIATLRSLMDNVPIEDKWRDVFPGCFAGLYRYALSQMRLSPSSPKGTAEGLKVLSRLLCLTLNQPRKLLEEVGVTGVLDEIRSLTVGSNDEKTQLVSAVDPFVKEANSRLPAPLIVLMGILPVAQSPSIRLAATEFCTALLVDIGVWTHATSSELELKAMECCLTLLRDKDARVASLSRTALNDYQLSIGPSKWPDYLNTLIVPRIIDILEELSALSRSRRETELRARLQLIGGYLSLAMNDTQENSPSAAHANRRFLRTSLAAEGVSSTMRKSLTDLFDIDFDSLQYSSTITSAAAIEESLVVHSNGSTHFRFRYMSDETRASADHVVQSFGKALGPKHAVSFVDGCIADLLDSRIGLNHNEQSHVVWLHQWVGYIIVATEVLVGAYGQPPRTPSSGNRKEHKRKRLLKSLASSVLPVITSAPLWNLPTAIEFPNNLAGNNEITESRLFRIDLGDNRVGFRDSDSSRQFDTSASALKGNASLICSLIQFIETFTGLLEGETESYLSVLLYPLFERASTSNHSQVQQAAVQSLGRIAVSCGMSGIPELVENYCDYLYGAMLSQVRPPGARMQRQVVYPVALPSVIEVVLRNSASAVKKSVGECEVDPKGVSIVSLKQRTNMSYVIEIVSELIASFDCSIVALPGNSTYQVMVSYDLARMCDAAMCYLSRCYEMKSENHVTSGCIPSVAVSTKPWLSALESFRFDKQREANEHEEPATPEEGFANYHEQRREADVTDDSEEITPVTSDEIEFVNLVLARACFFLSSPSLKVQVKSCDTLLHGFQFLGSLAKLEESTVENSTGTAILRSLSDSWPAIIARLNATAAMILKTEASNTHAFLSPMIKSSVDNDIVVQGSSMSRLLDLVAALCELAGDFMVGRFKNDVWPLVAQLIGRCVSATTRRQKLQPASVEKSIWTEIQAPNSNAEAQQLYTREHPRGSEIDALLAKLLEFLSRVYGSGCAQGLSEFIPLAGTMIIPLLSAENNIREKALEALRCMLMVDCDSLWRALLNLSGRGLPRRALNPQSGDDAPDLQRHEMTMERKGARDLLEFVISLPEQPLG